MARLTIDCTIGDNDYVDMSLTWDYPGEDIELFQREQNAIFTGLARLLAPVALDEIDAGSDADFEVSNAIGFDGNPVAFESF